MARQGRGGLGCPAVHLIYAVGTVLIHADALRAALHLGLLAAIGWWARGTDIWVGSLATCHPHRRGLGFPPLSENKRGTMGFEN